jgi:nitrate reductase gamma subunit
VEHNLRLRLFWAIHLITLGLFGIELLVIISVWLKARVPGVPKDASRWRKLSAALAHGLRLLLSRRGWAMLKALLMHGMVHQRLYRIDFRRWCVHISVFGSWLALGLLSIVTGMVVEVLPLLGMSPNAIAQIPVLGHLLHADVWWVAFVNEVLGLTVVAGMFLIVYRRYLYRDPQLRTFPADTIVISLLVLVALSGFPTETFRLLSDYTSAAGVFRPQVQMLSSQAYPPALQEAWGPQWGFAGYLSAQALGALKVAPHVWGVLHNLFFWLHFAIIVLLLYYLPFSRFFHIIMSPVIVAYNTMIDHERQPEDKAAAEPLYRHGL